MKSESISNTAPAPRVGEGPRVVVQGECIFQIATEEGHTYETIWNDASNQELRQTRKSPNLLLPGDRLTIPNIRLKSADGATEQRHRFRRKGVPIEIRIKFMLKGVPRSNDPFRLSLDSGSSIEGHLDAEGFFDSKSST